VTWPAGAARATVAIGRRRWAGLLSGLLAVSSLSLVVMTAVSGPAGAAPGALDTSFGSAGTALSSAGNGATGVAVVPAGVPDGAQAGDLAVSGSASSPPTFQVGLFTASGTLDTTFGGGLGLVSSFPGFAQAVAVVPPGLTGAGDVVAAGYLTSSTVTCGGSGPVPVVAEYTSSGTPVFTTDLRAATSRQASVQLIGGSTTVRTASATFATADVGAAICGTDIPAGAVIASVSNTTTAMISAPPTGSITTAATVSRVDAGQFNAVTVDSSGNIVTAGQVTSPSGTAEGLVTRLTPSGSLDTSFSTSGYVKTFVGAGANQTGFTSVAVVPRIQSPLPADAGDIMAGGYSVISGNQFLAVTALTSSGPDPAFGTSGAVQSTIVGSIANGVAALPNGNVVAGGSSPTPSGTGFLLAQYQPNGAVDTTFGPGGQVVGQPAIGVSDQLNAIAYQTSGNSLVAAGTAPNTGLGQTMVVAVYNATTGATNSSFGTGGLVQRGFGAFPASATAIAIQPDDKIVAAGQAPVVNADEGIGLIRMFGPTLPGGLVALTPTRIMDTRVANGAVGPVPADKSVSLAVLGHGGVPASGVGAVVLNVTVTQTTASGFVTVYPDGVTPPTTSNLNFTAGRTVPNLVVAPVGADGKVDFLNGSAGTVQIIADVSGWFASGSPAGGGGLAPLTPTRIMDTRLGTGALGPVPADKSVSLAVLGHGGIPASGVGAVVLNVTVTQTTAPGFVTVYPDGVTPPTTSNLNFLAGVTVPNLVIAPVGADGKVDFLNGSAGTVQIIADVSGWMSTP
jgi:uncharacterized delta-60 repeat protein